jgi:hypothetical protein
MARADAARSNSDVVVYSDVLGRKGHLGAAAVVLGDKLEITERV